MIELTDAERARFVGNIRKGDGCWHFGRAKSYGTFMVDRRRGYAAHRVSYELFVGPIPPGLVVRHKCDNPPCVRPDHLETGTLSDNARDTIERGHYSPNSGDGRLTVAAAARAMGLPLADLRALIRHGDIPISPLGGRQYIRWSVVNAYRQLDGKADRSLSNSLTHRPE